MKKAVNLSLDSALVDRARDLGLNLSQAVDGALRDAVRKAEEAAWLEENREAIEAYNRRIEERGTFSTGHRRF